MGAPGLTSSWLMDLHLLVASPTSVKKPAQIFEKSPNSAWAGKCQPCHPVNYTTRWVFEGLYKSSPRFLIALSIKDHTREFLPKMQIMLSSSKGLTFHSIKYLTRYSSITAVPREILLLNSDPPTNPKNWMKPSFFLGLAEEEVGESCSSPSVHAQGLNEVSWASWTLGVWYFALGEGVAPSLPGLGSSEKYFHSLNVHKYDIYVSAKTSGYAWWLWRALLKSWQPKP